MLQRGSREGPKVPHSARDAIDLHMDTIHMCLRGRLHQGNTYKQPPCCRGFLCGAVSRMSASRSTFLG